MTNSFLDDLTIKGVMIDVHETAKRSGFLDDNRTIGDRLMLAVSELSEALEEYRNGHTLTEIYYNLDKPTKPEGFPVELADCIIRLCETAFTEGIDLETAIRVKMSYNRTREFRHGGKKL